MPVNATRLIRKMRGGAQAHLLAADDGHCYVTKFSDNPQHRRILVNEWLAHTLLRYLQIPSPEVAVIQVSNEFLAKEQEVYYQMGARRQPVQPGWHFGSRFPGDPDHLAVYDYLPDTLLGKTANLRDFLGVLVFDKWVSNADSRQAIFFRSRIRQFLELADVSPQQKGFVTQMVDQGYIFSGPQWEFPDSPVQGLYFRPCVYTTVSGFADFEPWLNRVTEIPPEVLDEAWRRVPTVWLDDDGSALERLLETLYDRRKLVPDLLAACRLSSKNPFPQWQ